MNRRKTRTGKVPPPFTRVPIKPKQRHKDRKNDYRRKPKHQEGQE